MDINKIKVNQNKEKILTWLEEANIAYTITDIEKSNRKDLLFSIIAGNPSVAIYTMTAIPDRINLQTDIVFGGEHIQLLEKMSEAVHSKLIVDISSSLTTFNIRHRFFLKDNKLEKIRLYLFMHDDSNILNKDRFLQDFLRVQEVTRLLLDIINMNLGIAIKTQTAQQDEDTRDRPGVT